MFPDIIIIITHSTAVDGFCYIYIKQKTLLSEQQLYTKNERDDDGSKFQSTSKVILKIFLLFSAQDDVVDDDDDDEDMHIHS